MKSVGNAILCELLYKFQEKLKYWLFNLLGGNEIYSDKFAFLLFDCVILSGKKMYEKC